MRQKEREREKCEPSILGSIHIAQTTEGEGLGFMRFCIYRPYGVQTREGRG